MYLYTCIGMQCISCLRSMYNFFSYFSEHSYNRHLTRIRIRVIFKHIIGVPRYSFITTKPTSSKLICNSHDYQQEFTTCMHMHRHTDTHTHLFTLIHFNMYRGKCPQNSHDISNIVQAWPYSLCSNLHNCQFGTKKQRIVN